MAQVVLWPDEIRAPTGLVESAPEPRRQELQMALTLMQSLAEDFHIEQQRDHYREALDDVVAAKPADQEPSRAPTPDTEPVLDLMPILQQSVQAAQADRGTDKSTSKRRGPAPAGRGEPTAQVRGHRRVCGVRPRWTLKRGPHAHPCDQRRKAARW
ncbi:hypothetical protein [Streptomyces chattanoogensis]|uniref:hypothetical protein n=1 Tax=Streptomyces chattanoogensis TaxID=66876 RepID=UPI0036853281